MVFDGFQPQTCGWCYHLLDYNVKTLNVAATVYSGLLLVGMFTLLYRLGLSYSYAINPMSRPLLPVQDGSISTPKQPLVHPLYYTYTQVACLVIFLMMVTLMVPVHVLGPGNLVYDIVNALQCGFLENAVGILLLYKKIDRYSIRQTIFFASLMCFGHLLMLLYSRTRLHCQWCTVFIPTPDAIFMHLALTIFYSVLLVLQFPRSPLKGRPAAVPWFAFLALIYGILTFGLALLMVFKQDAGFCVLAAMIVLYSVAYPLLLFYVFKNDTEYIWQNGSDDSILTEVADPGKLFTNDDASVLRILSHDPHMKIISGSEVTVQERIGAGGYGAVFRGSWRGTPVAIKRGHGTVGDMTSPDFIKEIRMLGQLRHPNILLFQGVMREDDKFSIITEYMPYGSVYGYIHRKPRRTLTWKAVVNMCLGVSRAMAYLHGFNPVILHRDLKSANILIDKYFNTKICDFGASRPLANTLSYVGTLQWAAPEVLRNESYSKGADVYSFGMCLYEMVSGMIPFHQESVISVVRQVGDEGARPPIPDRCLPAIAAIMKDCWQHDPAARPSFDKLVWKFEALDMLPGLDKPIQWAVDKDSSRAVDKEGR